MIVNTFIPFNLSPLPSCLLQEPEYAGHGSLKGSVNPNVLVECRRYIFKRGSFVNTSAVAKNKLRQRIVSGTLA